MASHRLLLGLLLAILGLSAMVTAQAVPGVPSWGTLQGGKFDPIDVANRQLRVTIPLVNKKGIGVDFSIPFEVDSLNWQPLGGTWSPYRASVGMVPVMGYISYNSTENECEAPGGDWYTYFVYDAYVYIDPEGVKHPLVDPTSHGDVITEDAYPLECSGSGPYPLTADGIAADASGYALEVQGWKMVSAASPAGTTSAVNGTTQWGGTVTDPSGNTITSTYALVWPVIPTITLQDTLGVTELTATYESDHVTVTYAYPKPGGGTAEYVETDEDFTLQTAFGCPGVSEYSSGGANWRTPEKLELPDGSAYQFTYEQTPGYPAGTTTGRLASMELPTGATIHYSYPSTGSVDCATGDTTEIDRNTPDGTTK